MREREGKVRGGLYNFWMGNPGIAYRLAFEYACRIKLNAPYASWKTRLLAAYSLADAGMPSLHPIKVTTNWRMIAFEESRHRE
jgi:hypothetical protein